MMEAAVQIPISKVHSRPTRSPWREREIGSADLGLLKHHSKSIWENFIECVIVL